MGINNLFPFLKNYSTTVHLSNFSGKVAAVDGSCWIHKGLAISMKQNGNRERFSRIFKNFLQLLSDSGVTPIVVFDGKPLVAKADENCRRQRRREEQLRKANEQNTGMENKLLSQSVEMTYNDVVECIQVCLSQGIRYVVSPYESDAQLAFLVKQGYADFVITEDSDLLVYGCKDVVVKLKLNGHGENLKLYQILDGLKVTMTQFVHGCIAAGCDYLPNVRGVGIHKAFGYVQAGTLFTELRKKGASENYESLFKKAEAVFKHQTVFNLSQLQVQPLQSWPEDPDEELQEYCGAILDSDLANELAAGNINMKSGEKLISFPILKMIPLPKQDENVFNPSEATVMELTITRIADTSFSWTIPNFPVISVDFVKVTAEENGKEIVALVKKGATVSLGKVRCTSHCQILIENILHMVLWEFVPYPQVESTVTPNPPTPLDSAIEPVDLETMHSLPFKVLGTCHSKDRQRILERADDLIQGNRPVFVSLEPEPDNPHDPNAIAVFLQTDNDFELVGYLARELTKYVQPCLNSPDFHATLKSIRFRTTYMLMGYYLTVDLTRKGLWNNNVVKASRHVM